jgi:hypothetical protein
LEAFYSYLVRGHWPENTNILASNVAIQIGPKVKKMQFSRKLAQEFDYIAVM